MSRSLATQAGREQRSRELAALQDAEAILVVHQRRGNGGCLCGWDELGATHTGHLVAKLREAGAIPQTGLSPAALVAALGTSQPPPDAVMGSLTVWAREGGSVGIEAVGGPLLSMSLALFAQQHDGTRFVHVQDGEVVVEGYDRQDRPVQYRYRAVGLQVADAQYLAAHEGGFLLLERLS